MQSDKKGPYVSELVVAFLGDIVGRPGRRVIEQQIGTLIAEHHPQLVIANAENARSGSGLTPAIFQRLRDCGIGAVTLGDHALRDKRIFDLLQDPAAPIARPANLPDKAPGKRLIRLGPVEGSSRPIVILTVLGRIYMPLAADDPFACVDAVIAEQNHSDAIVIVEAHMETTGEKAALAHYLEGRVSAVVGTHTHVPTADARILSGGTAFITDIGMCGPFDSVIGRDTQAVVRHMTTAMHVPYAVAERGAAMCGAIIRIDESTGHAAAIKRIEYRADESRPPFG